MILGIDEVGRGPWAGPLVVGAVVLSGNAQIVGLNDSKKLSAKRRQELDETIRAEALGYGIGWVHAEELDTVGLAEALRLATIRAVEQVKVPYHEIIIDGTINFLKETSKGAYVTMLPKADALIPAVSAASIIAKVARDAYMAEQDAIYTGYGFASHVGYGTAAHQKALTLQGITPLHRKSFAPIRKILDSGEGRPEPVQKTSKITTKSKGDDAERMVEKHLIQSGYKILERNWKTKWCEIDIVAQKSDIIYCIEVKYRSSNQHGDGVSAITPKKLKQMRFAAKLYSSRVSPNSAVQLLASSVDAQGVIELLKVD